MGSQSAETKLASTASGETTLSPTKAAKKLTRRTSKGSGPRKGRASLGATPELNVLDLNSIVLALTVAEHLSVRQSAVSRRVRALEDSLGVSIFERHHCGVRLTDARVRFLGVARSALTQLNTAARIADAAGRGENGVLRIGISSSIAAGYCGELTVEAFLKRVGSEYPRPRVCEGRRKLWLKDDLDRAIAPDPMDGDLAEDL